MTLAVKHRVRYLPGNKAAQDAKVKAANDLVKGSTVGCFLRFRGFDTWAGFKIVFEISSTKNGYLLDKEFSLNQKGG